MISKKLAIEFQEAVKNDRGMDLTEEQAAIVLDGWTNCFGLLGQIYHRIKLDEIEENDKVLSPVLEAVKGQFRLNINSLHGIGHWGRVKTIGLRLALPMGADLRVVHLFSILHDSQRENEDDDPEHGERAADYAKELFEKGLLPITGQQLGQLACACASHSHSGARSDNVTVQVCWDADRLDLYRVGIIPDPEFLYTDIAKTRELMDYAILLFSGTK